MAGRFYHINRDSAGNTVGSATVTVTDTGGSAVSVYSDFALSAEKGTNGVFTSDADGTIEFYAATGLYDIQVVKTGYDTVTIEDVQVGVDGVPETRTLTGSSPIQVDGTSGVAKDLSANRSIGIDTSGLVSTGRTLTGTAPIEVDGSSGVATDLSSDRTLSIDATAFLQPSNNLGEVTASTARTNLDVPGLSTSNTLTGAQTITGDLTVDDVGNAGNLILGSDQSSGTPGVFRFRGHNSGGSNVFYGQIFANLVDNTAGSEAASLDFQVMSGGVIGTKLSLKSDGSLRDGPGNAYAASSGTKTTAGAPYTNDGYIELDIGGTTIKVMTTA